MSKKIIPFDSLKNGLALLSWVNEIPVKESDFKEVIFDLTNCKFIETHDVVVLSCICNFYKESGIKISFSINHGGSVFKYLANIGFFNYFNYPLMGYEPIDSLTTNKLSHVIEEYANSYPDIFVRYFERNLFEGKNLSSLGSTLSELLNNICDHSKTKNAFTLGQYFPKKEYIKLCICDLGAGIPKTILNYMNAINSPLENELKAFELALQLGFSTKSTPRNRGLGLATVKSIIQNLQGYVYIFSNSVVYLANFESSDEKKHHIYLKQKSSDFPGTFILIKINTNKLPLLGVEESLDFN